ncbi:MAG: hypothetical protein RJA59_1356 [Pseudomonadota bacterium]
MTSRRAAVALWVGLLAAHPGAGLAQETESSRATPLVGIPAKGDDLPRGDTAYVDRRDITDIFRKTPKEKAQPEPYVLYPSIIPAIGYNPALGFLIGVVSKAGMLLGDPGDTTMSSASLLVLLTTNKQLVLQLGSTILTSHNEWMLIGDWRFLLYNQETYGLSTGTPVTSTSFSISGWGSTTPIDGGQPMQFDLLRLHQVGLRRVWGDFYVGGGIRIDRYFGIVDELLDLTAPSPVITSHYAYSTYFGFNPSEYTLSGVTLNAVYDSRDSTINAYKGIYAQLAFGGFPTWLGSSQGSTMIGVDFRAYLGLSEAVPRNVIAFWLLASGVTSGVQPYLTLPSIGWDAAGTTGRGYVQGRFRGPGAVYAEAEWRFRITDDGLFGGAVFVNAETFTRPAFSYSTLSEPAVNLFQYVKPAGGIGARIMMSKESRTNLRVDFAVGVDSWAIYLGAGEVF